MKKPAVLPFVLQQRAATRAADPLVSCLIPAYNEALNIVPLLNALHTLLTDAGFRHELVVVDDGSSDDTVQRVLDAASQLPVTLIQLSRNFGKELAMTAGLDEVKGDVVVLLDGDFQNPPEMLPRFLQHWREGYDMVYCVRPDRHYEPALKRLLTDVFYAVLNAGSRHPIPQNSLDFRLMDRCVVDALCQLPERNRFMKGLFNWVGFTQLEIVMPYNERRAGQSGFNLTRLAGLALTGLTAFSHVPLRVWTLFGTIISILAIGYGCWELFNTLLFGNPLQGWPTLAVAVSFLGGVQLLSIGILGEYIGRIFTEVKQRPTYLVSTVTRSNSLKEAEHKPDEA